MRRSLAGLLLGIGLASPGLAVADWMGDYDRGLRAFRSGNFEEAENYFRSAIREKREPVVRQRFQGSRFEPYVPQHWAAMAAWQRGNCNRALDYWQQAGLGDVLAELPDLQSEQARGLAACRQQTAAVTPPPETSSEPSEPATGSATPPVTTTTRPSEVASTRPATDPPATVPRPTTPSRPTTPVATAPTRPAPAPSTPRPTSSTASARTPAELSSAVDAWLGGRYGELMRIDPPPMSDRNARAQVLLLRAAARFVLAELDGAGETTMEAVRTDVRGAKAANASLTPDAGMFPPRFRALWSQTR